MRYVVDVVGDTTCDPFNATVVPFKSALTALLVVHVRVELPPGAMTVGFPLIPAASVCARARAGVQISTTIPINNKSKIRNSSYRR